jgi:hypothetical protein
MNNARMIELAEHLESLPRKRFDMTSFWNVVRSRKPGAADPDEVLNEGRESAKREDASRLFHQGMRMTPRQAAKRIRKAVKRGYVEDIGD